jgi:DNA-binding response OmpR family regulator
MIVRPDDELTRLRRENRELREEIEEYRRKEAELIGAVKAQFDPGLLTDLRQALRLPPAQAKLLLILLDAAPSIIPREKAAVAISISDHPSDMKVVDVQLSHLRKALTRQGLPGPQTATGYGYRLTAEDAHTIRSTLWPKAAAA